MKKYGPAPLTESEKRLLVTLSLSNKEQPRRRLERLRIAAQRQAGASLSDAQLTELVKQVAYTAIDQFIDNEFSATPENS